MTGGQARLRGAGTEQHVTVRTLRLPANLVDIPALVPGHYLDALASNGWSFNQVRTCWACSSGGKIG